MTSSTSPQQAQQVTPEDGQGATSESRAWHGFYAARVASDLGVVPEHGLSAGDVSARLKRYGPNRLAEKKQETGWQAFLRQYRDLMQIILLSAAVVNVVVTGVWSTTIVLVLLTIFNAVLGLRQESKAEASLAALSETMKNIARVRRDGDAVEVDFSTGVFINRSRAAEHRFNPIPEALRPLVACGGTRGFLRDWWQANQGKHEARDVSIKRDGAAA